MRSIGVIVYIYGVLIDTEDLRIILCRESNLIQSMETRKVIAFCLWGREAKYNTGAVKNARLAAEIYPDWEPWFYCANDLGTDINDDLRQSNARTRIFLKEKNCDWSMMLDRLSPSLEPSVGLFISRDCDSRLSLREKVAVDEWMEGDKTWHLMCDHPYHSVPILGGMFGVKQSGFNTLYKRAQQWQESTKPEWQQDQNFLRDVVWPEIQGDYLRHDDGFFTHLWGGKPFPKPRQGLEFVGQVFDEHDITIAEHQTMLKKALR